MNDTPEPVPKRRKRGRKPKPPSRSDRWKAAAAKLRTQFDFMETTYGEIENALSELKEVQEEFSNWKDNMPESLADSPTGTKLEAVCEIELDQDPRDLSNSELDELVGQIDDAELPVGFGRD